MKLEISAQVAGGLFSGMQWHDGSVPNWPPPTTTSQARVTLIQVTEEGGVLSNSPVLGGVAGG